MKSHLPPYIRLRQSDPQYEEELRAYFAGTSQSAWTFLAGAAASNVVHTLVEASRLIKFCGTAIKNGQQLGEILFLANVNYGSMSGPALGSILGSSAALEAGLRAIGRAYFERHTSKGRRGTGTSKLVASQIAEFDDLPFLVKVGWLFEKILGRDCPTDLGDEVRQLISFRNEVLHAEPALRTWSGRDEIVHRGRAQKLPTRDRKSYPLLWASNRPLSPKHTLRAIRAHDRLVAEFASTPEIERLRNELDLGKHLEFALIERQLLPVRGGDPDNICARYELLDHALSEIPDDERRKFALEMNRKAMVRRVK